MNVSEEILENGIHKISLSGRMDIEGVNQIDIKFTGMTASPRMTIIVDMADVEFLSSFGIRLLLSNAKAVGRRGGKLALFNLSENVEMVLNTTGIDKLIPLCSDIEAAKAAVLA